MTMMKWLTVSFAFLEVSEVLWDPSPGMETHRDHPERVCTVSANMKWMQDWNFRLWMWHNLLQLQPIYIRYLLHGMNE